MNAATAGAGSADKGVEKQDDDRRGDEKAYGRAPDRQPRSREVLARARERLHGPAGKERDQQGIDRQQHFGDPEIERVEERLGLETRYYQIC